jgi:hypothetical protein
MRAGRRGNFLNGYSPLTARPAAGIFYINIDKAGDGAFVAKTTEALVRLLATMTSDRYWRASSCFF